MLINRTTSASGAFLWPAALVVWGPGSTSSVHAHHCIQLILALRCTMRARGGPGQRWRRCGAVLVKPDTPHEVIAGNYTVLIAFVERESPLGAALLARVPAGLNVIPPRDVSRWRRALGDAATLDDARVEPWLRSELLRNAAPPTMHPRIQRVLRILREGPVDPADTSIEQLAKLAGLSPSRFRHAFTESLGIPPRPYLLWLRLQKAAGALATGQTVTEAAYAAGFADAAHLSRTFRRMLGAAPRELISRLPATRELQLRLS
ncbi:MAG: helix-turn-helix domain-containing protein [Sulfurifustaceae bacterium]